MLLKICGPSIIRSTWTYIMFSWLRCLWSFDLPEYHCAANHHCCTQAIITAILSINDKLTLPVKHTKHPLHYLFWSYQGCSAASSRFLCSFFPKYFWCMSVTFFLYSSHLRCCTCHQWQAYVAYKTYQASWISLRCWSSLLYSSHHRCCTCHQWQAYAACKTYQTSSALSLLILSRLLCSVFPKYF